MTIEILKIKYAFTSKEVKWRLMMKAVYGLLAVMALCFILVPIVAYLFGGWYAYWGHALLAIIFSVMVVLIRTRYYWEEN